MGSARAALMAERAVPLRDAEREGPKVLPEIQKKVLRRKQRWVRY